jgi:hypothetical protein
VICNGCNKDLKDETVLYEIERHKYYCTFCCLPIPAHLAYNPDQLELFR